MKPVIVFATANENKTAEVRELLKDLYEVKSLIDIGCTEDIPETTNTLEGNAKQKADYVKEKYGYDCFADDTGLEVKALDGAPGVFTARYGGPEKDAQQNMNYLMNELEKVGALDPSERSARFRTAIHLIINGKEVGLEGVCKGHIAPLQSGTAGFGYDPVFIPKGEDRTFSEMSAEEKNSMSHRGSAIRSMLEYLGV
ncbi:MAG: RdgB/HAM1 family non-canonical purine NTP pyrophosphatase [Flavobacteriales bacterium]|jgi:XTP/dITP diphosphohydrolase|nr:RdgB/HAM1 family non-canonical purine NTP pyrophosphatase [Flavobacteriales bacterium]